MANDDITWITKGGKHIPIGATNDYMNKYIRNKGKTKEQQIEELRKKYDKETNIFKKGEIQEEINMLKDDFKGTKEEYRKYIEEKQEKRLKEYKNEKEERLKIKEKQEKEAENRDYRMAHRPSKGATLDDVTKYSDNDNDNYSPALPKDFYEHPEYYGNMREKSYQESFEAIRKARNNSNGMITIYRATTGNKINDGDWITLSKSYAENHKNSWLGGKGKVIEMKVPITDVRFAGDDFNEFGYFPKKRRANK